MGGKLDILVEVRVGGAESGMCRLYNGVNPNGRGVGRFISQPSYLKHKHISLGYLTSVCIAFALVCPCMIDLDEIPTWDIDLSQWEKYNTCCLQHTQKSNSITRRYFTEFILIRCC